jgi:hypothetical protein
MNKQENPYKIVNNYLIFKEWSSDALGVNYRAGEIVPGERKAAEHSLITEVYPFLYKNPNTWKKVNILLEGVRKSNIPKLYSPEKIFRENDKYYLAYPIFKGKTFEQVLDDSTQRDLPMNFDLAFSIAFAIADLIDVGSSIVVSGEKSFHGFLTPDNVLIDYDGKILLKNYGIYPYLSKEEEILAELEKKYGSWIAPEILRKEKPVAQSDIYHLGYMTYRVLTGKYFSCAPDEDFDAKFSNISFSQHIPSSDKEFLTNIITYFKKTLNPFPSRRFSTIKEYKDFISSHFHIEELSSITFNLAYFMNSLYLEFMEEENKTLEQELAYVIPEEKKAEVKPEKDGAQLVEEILTGLDGRKKSRTKFLIPLIALIVIVVGVSAFIIYDMNRKATQKQEQDAKNISELKKQRDAELKQLEASFQQKLKNIEQKAATTEEEKKSREDEIKKLQEWQKEETRKALDKQKAEADKLKKIEDDKKKKEEEQENQKKLDEQKKQDEITKAKAVEEQKKKEEQKKNIEEAQRTVEGQLIALSVVSEKPVLTKQENIAFPSMIMKKYKGNAITAHTLILIDETGTVTDVKLLAKIPGDLESIIMKTLKKWKYSPAKKDNVKVKVWLPVDVNINL